MFSSGFGSELKRNTNFEIANAFNITVFPTRERSRSRHMFRIFCIFLSCGS